MVKDNHPGIYAIECKATNSVYVGSSNSISSRRYRHFGDLRKNIHRIEQMQKDFNKYGRDGFNFFVLLKTNKDKNVQLSLENDAMESYFDLGWKLYNLSPTSTRKGYKEPEEVKKKLSEDRKGIKNANSKYTLDDFKKVKELLLKGYSCYTVSEKTGISSSLIKDFRKGKHWATEELGCINDWLKEDINNGN